MEPLRIALTKGRLEQDTVALFEQSGFDCSALKDKKRKLVFTLTDANVEIVLVKAADVITYVERGACDLGVVGKDTIMEYGQSFYEIADLGFGKCRFALAGKKGVDFYQGYNVKRIATKYAKITRNYFEAKGMDVEIIPIDGSVELAPILGISDAIVDIVETGATLKENGLEIYEEICPVSARMIVNVVSMKMKKREIETLTEKLGHGIQ